MTSAQGEAPVEAVAPSAALHFEHEFQPGFVSIVVPVAADPEGLEVTLRSMQEHFPAGAFEVIVANDGGDEATSQMVGRFPFAREISLVPNRGPAGARNAAMQTARGEFIAFVDADIVVWPNWWSAMMESLQHAEVVCGQVEVDPSMITTFAHYYESVVAYDVPRYVSRHHAVSGNLAARRTTLERIGGFDLRFRSGEDNEFGKRAHRLGVDLAYSAEMGVYHPPRDGRAQHRKLYRVVVGRLQLAEAMPQRFSGYRLTPRLVVSLLAPPRRVARSSVSLRDVPLHRRARLYAYQYERNLASLLAYIWVTVRGAEGRRHDLS